MLIAVLGGASLTARATESIVNQLLTGYETLQTVSCEVRRTTDSAGTKVQTLSRVFFQKPDKLHVENVSPLPRRIVSDGVTFFSHIDGDAKGFSRPVNKLDTDMLISLKKVPATAMDHLLRLRGISETNLTGNTTYPVRKGYDTGKLFAVLSLDQSNRLARLDFYTGPDLIQPVSRVEYSNFIEAAHGIWVPRLHQSTHWIGGVETRETARFDNLSINQPIAQNLFIASNYFKKIDFVPTFEQMYP
jgi:hypothetical protein